MVEEVFEQTTQHIEQIYEHLTIGGTKLMTLRAPTSDTPKTPVSLMRTMAVDMTTGWFESFFRRKDDSAAFVKKLTDVASAEMEATLQDMLGVYVNDFASENRAKLDSFLVEHRETLHNLLLLYNEKERGEVIKALGLDVKIRKRITALESIRDDLLSLDDVAPSVPRPAVKCVA